MAQDYIEWHAPIPTTYWVFKFQLYIYTTG